MVRGTRDCAKAISFFLAFLLLAGTAVAQQDVVAEIVIHGNRRIPAETIRARMFTKPGDVYDQAALERDFNSLWNTGYFDDLRIEREQSSKGWIIHVYVKEKPTIREIKYTGLSSVSQSDVLDKFKEQKVGLTQESQYDPTKVKHAEVVIKQLLAAHGRQFATVTSEVRPIPPAAVSLTFVVKEGPKVKVGKIKFEGNKALSNRELQSAMKNLKPIGIPHSIFLENLFARTYDSTKLIGRRRARALLSIRPRAISRPWSAIPKRRFTTPAAFAGISPSSRRRAKRWTSPFRWKKASATA